MNEFIPILYLYRKWNMEYFHNIFHENSWNNLAVARLHGILEAKDILE
jgi:hypothetical protein